MIQWQMEAEPRISVKKLKEKNLLQQVSAKTSQCCLKNDLGSTLPQASRTLSTKM